jgi:hypothetical protein
VLDHDWPKNRKFFLPDPKIQAENKLPIKVMLGIAEVDFDLQPIFANHRF